MHIYTYVNIVPIHMYISVYVYMYICICVHVHIHTSQQFEELSQSAVPEIKRVRLASTVLQLKVTYIYVSCVTEGNHIWRS